MSCRQYEGDDFKHFIVYHIKEFDRLRRKSRKRRKRRMRATTTATVTSATNATQTKLQL